MPTSVLAKHLMEVYLNSTHDKASSKVLWGILGS